jgi:hypothetical protein
MAKRRKKITRSRKGAGFGIKEWLIIGGAGLVAFLLFRPKAQAGTYIPQTGSGGSTGGSGGSTGGSTGASGGGGGGLSLPTGGSTGVCANLLANGFPNRGWNPNPPMDYPGVTLNPNKQITLGSTGYEVLAIQIWTNGSNTTVLELDGIYGPLTMSAFKNELIRTNSSGSNIVNNFKFNDVMSLKYVYPLRNQKTLTTSIIPSCPSLKTFLFGSVEDYDGRLINGTPNVN